MKNNTEYNSFYYLDIKPRVNNEVRTNYDINYENSHKIKSLVAFYLVKLNQHVTFYLNFNK